MHGLSVVAKACVVGVFALAAAASAWLWLGPAPAPGTRDWLLAAALAATAATCQVFVVRRAKSSHPDRLTAAPVFAALILLPAPLLPAVVATTFLPEWVFRKRRAFAQLLTMACWLVASALARAVMAAAAALGGAAPLGPFPPLAAGAGLGAFLGCQTLLRFLARRITRGHSGHSTPETSLLAPEKLFAELALLCFGWILALACAHSPLSGLASGVPLAFIYQALHVPKLREEASTDPKTGLANMRHFGAVFERDLARAGRSGQPLSVLMCDLDLLRDVNNRYGHSAGDVVLCGLAEVIRRTVRACDLAARFGGEEFVILLTDTGSSSARRVAERIRTQFAGTSFDAGGAGAADGAGRVIHVTVSIGVATYPLHAPGAPALLEAADSAMYQAKREGRNRVVVASRSSGARSAAPAQPQLAPARLARRPSGLLATAPHGLPVTAAQRTAGR
jgi:diguanylate cyclase (GGDEF)-like protein